MDLAVHLSGIEPPGGILSPIGYRRLPGTRRGLFARASAWAGTDHILLVEGSRVSETYKRVYFRDVQALLVTKRNRFVIQTPVLLLLPALTIAIIRLPADSRATGGLIAGLILLAALIYLFIAGSYYGCRLYLATAVGNVRVTSVFRLWQAQNFNERVNPLIMAAQQSPIAQAEIQ